jgi:hypothetical protein
MVLGFTNWDAGQVPDQMDCLKGKLRLLSSPISTAVPKAPSPGTKPAKIPIGNPRKVTVTHGNLNTCFGGS